MSKSSEIILIRPFDFESDVLANELQLSLLTLGSFLLQNQASRRELHIIDLNIENQRNNLTIPKDEQSNNLFQNEFLSP